MSQQVFDRSTKWLVEQHGRDVLYLGRVRDVRRCQALQAELVQPRRLPDGLLEVFFQGQKKPGRVLVEVATYPEKRVVQQAMDDLTLAALHLGELPDLLVLVLCRKGKQRVAAGHEVRGKLGWSRLAGAWKVVELWTLEAEELLAVGELGLIPWVPLTTFAGPPERLLERCREQIERQAGLEERANLLAVSQVLAGLRFTNEDLLSILGGREVMIESPVLRKLIAEELQDALILVLAGRFGTVPTDLTTDLRKITKEAKLRELFSFSGVCPTLEAFHERMVS
jgi:hypothetical protein